MIGAIRLGEVFSLDGVVRFGSGHGVLAVRCT
jgi:hypothetical protein